jgi:hypothetical protein
MRAAMKRRRKRRMAGVEEVWWRRTLAEARFLAAPCLANGAPGRHR